MPAKPCYDRVDRRSITEFQPPIPARMSPLQAVLDILDLEPLEVNLFRGRSPQSGWQRVFGGQVIGQALVAACRTVEGRSRIRERRPAR